MIVRPILYSAPMVPPILADTKTQTRRTNGLDFINENPGCWQRQWVPAKDGKHWLFTCGDDQVHLRCPYGVEGDRLWVRETWGYTAVWPMSFQREHTQMGGPWNSIFMAYRADGRPGNWCWRPSIHMPRWASRILLEITAVRCERLLDISEADAVAEGIEVVGQSAIGPLYRDYTGDNAGHGWNHAPSSYLTLWASIHGPDSWAANPWVWVVEFKRVK
jgi:hypothetical protein